jgi:YD repeat-containing protein
MDVTSPGYGEADARVSGYLEFPTGVTYRIDNSNISWIRDRNGNTTTFSYTTGSNLMWPTWYLPVDAPTQVVDSLGRTTTLNYSDTSCGGCTTITYAGFGGASRVIQIVEAHLSASGMLRSDYASVKTIDGLFPNTGQPTSYNFNPILTQSITFPDGRQFTFQYDPYGELARINLPTGGAVEYDYGNGHNSSTGDGFEGVTTDNNPVIIYRRLLERREYANGGSTATSQTAYTTSYDSSGNLTETDAVSNPGGAALAQTVHIFNGSPLDARSMNGTSCNAWNEGLESQTNSGLTASGGSVQSVWNGYASQSGCMNNPLVVSRVTTLSDTNQQSRIAYAYDQYANVTDKQYYDWGVGAAGALVREEKTQYDYITGTVNGVAVSVLNKPSQITITNGSAAVSQTTYQYDGQSPSNASGITGHDAAFTTAFNLRGNLTNVATCTNPPACGSVINHALTYDIAGNILTAADGKGNTTTLSYNDDGQNQYAFATTVVNALSQKTSASYDYNIGEALTTTDANGNVTSSQYNDPLDRLTQTSFPDGGGTYYTYPNPNTVITNRDQSTAGDKYQQEQQAYDGLGRPTESDQYEYWQISPYAITSSTVGYDPLGRKASLTVNSWSGTPASYQETYQYDSIGRLTTTTTPVDGTSITRSYAGNQVTETDQAGITKASWTDALGRLTQVVEDPSGKAYSTAYSYDPFGNLTLVSQNMTCPAAAPTQAAQGCRYYSYDALGRLQWALQPESGKTSYQYDNANNVTTRTDARSVKTTVCHEHTFSNGGVELCER